MSGGFLTFFNVQIVISAEFYVSIIKFLLIVVAKVRHGLNVKYKALNKKFCNTGAAAFHVQGQHGLCHGARGGRRSERRVASCCVAELTDEEKEDKLTKKI